MKRAAIFTVAALALVAGVGTADGSTSPSPAQIAAQYTPAQLQAFAQSPHAAPAASGTAQRVSPQTVLADAAQPGASVESAPGLSPQAATGATGTASMSALAASTAIYCWNHTFYDTWGTWPQYQDLFENRDWCGHYGGAQTYRVSHVNGGTLTCDWNQAYSYLVSGGNGSTWSVVRSGAHYTCPTGIPWLNLHFDHWMEQASNTWGNYSFVRDSG